MGFHDTYREEVLQSRRIRSRRALFWTRILGLVLAITVTVIVRSEPALRRALVDAAQDGVARITGIKVPDGSEAPAPRQAHDRSLSKDPVNTALQVLQVMQEAPRRTHMPASRVKVNRHGSSRPAFGAPVSVEGGFGGLMPQNVDPQDIAKQMSRAVSQIENGF